ncbi:MAG: DNA polymerase III subunit alpha [Bacteroidaceae bacterium]|nr:DNA polymerase III subunit alpha [Bacteroidaceae bacterium]
MHDFVHLHVHTQYSILDGQAAIDKLVTKAVKDGMRAMAVTDHGNMMGIKEFFDVATKMRARGRKALEETQQKLDALNTEGGAAASTDEADKLRRDMEKARVAADFMPIFGCEMYVARRTMADKTEKADMGGNHLVVLAKNERGYHNLVKLVSKAWVDGFYMKPRTDHAELERHAEGLIVCSACLAGEVPRKIAAGDIAGAEESILWFKRVFGDDYYLELQRHRVTDPSIRANRECYEIQQRINPVLIELAHKHGVKLVCTNDVHFVDEENAEAHDRLICLSTGKDLDDPKRMVYTKQEWFKTRAEMNALFSDVPEALDGTVEVASKVEYYSINHAPIMPNFPIPEDFGTEEGYRAKYSHQDLFDEFTRNEVGEVVCTQEEGEKKIARLGGYDKLYRLKLEADYLGRLAYEGAERRYGSPIPENVREQVNFELYIMKTMGFPGYFLIVQDYIAAARQQLDVSVGPGRGSAAGSVVAYCLGITQIDPIKYDLLFERFLNPDRISLPDIDVDFDDDGRERVLQWVTQKYGEENVAHIITYGTMATKLALKDVARVEKVPLAQSNALCKLIPDRLPEGPDGKTPKMNLANAIAAIPELRQAESSPDEKLRHTIHYAKMLEGNVRNTGVHACGFIICRDPISDWVPVSVAEDKATGQKLHCTQYEGKVIEDTGLIKMDFLGLKTLSIIREALANIRESVGVKIDIDNIPIDDPKTYQLYCEGRTIGTFQFESAGMQKYLRELQPSTFEDLIAMNALYRPGPMQYIPQFIARKHGREPIVYDLPCMEEYLKDTYGITVYQEQVMLLSRKIANFTRGESDTLRKAMGKKLIDKLNHMYPKFIAGGTANGHDEKKLEKIWDDWRAFASYAFNKSHATCYSWVAFQTAYLKAHYPAQYMAAAMSRNLDNITEIAKLMDECKSMGIRTLSPDVNESRRKFSVNADGDIRFGLAAIKGMGSSAADFLIAEREKNGPFTSPYDLMERVSGQAVNRKCFESLVLAGALDCFKEFKREQYLAKDGNTDFLDTLIRYGQLMQQEKQQSAVSLFGGMDAVEVSKPKAPADYEHWSDIERLGRERELIGIYLSGHPLDEYRVVLQYVCNTRMAQLDDRAALQGRELTFGGMVTGVRTGFSRQGNPYGIVKIEDFEGAGELPLFGDEWAKWSGYMQQGNPLYITARVEPRRYNAEQFDLRIGRVELLPNVRTNVVQTITLHVPLDIIDPTFTDDLTAVVQANPGSVPLFLHITDRTEQTDVQLRSTGATIAPNPAVFSWLEGNMDVRLTVNR